MNALTDWRLALRVGLRQARRAWGRSLLVVLVVSLPVTVLAALATALATHDVSPAEELPARLGSAQTRLVPGPDRAFTQTGPGRSEDVLHADAREVDALPAAELAARLGHAPTDLTPVIGPLQGSRGTASGARRSTEVLLVDPLRSDTAGMVDLVSGRLPAADDEVVVTERGLRGGLPSSGTVALQVAPAPSREGRAAQWWQGQDMRLQEANRPVGLGELTVVGVVSSPTSADVVAPPGALGEHAPEPTHTPSADDPFAPLTHYLLGGDAVGDQVPTATEGGWVLQDRAATTALPSTWRESLRHADSGSGVATMTLVGLGVLLVLAQAALMVGPAFAIGYDRQRRDLAQLAANGATRTQLRRYLLGQAVVLGALTALLSAVAGVALVWLAHRWASRRWPDAVDAPFDVPWTALLVLALVAVATVVLAALRPARRVFREDAARAVRTGFADPAPSARVPWVLGPVFLLAAGLLTWLPLHRFTDAEGVLVVCSLVLALLVSAVLLVPWCLHTAGRWAERLPVAPRLAVRDIARHRSRSAPTVGAVIGAVALLVSGSMIGGAWAESQAAPEGDWTMAGTLHVRAGGDSPTAETTRRAQDRIAAVAPEAGTLWMRSRVDDPRLARTLERTGSSSPSEAGGLSATSARCAPEHLRVRWWRDATGTTSSPNAPDNAARCWALPGETVVVADDQVRRLGLSEAEVAALEAGTVLLGSSADEHQDDRLHLTTWAWMDPGSGRWTRAEVDRLAADPQLGPTVRTVDAAPLTTDLPGSGHLVLVPQKALGGATVATDDLVVVGDVSWVEALRLMAGGGVDNALYQASPRENARYVVAGLALLACLVLLVSSVIGAALRQREAAREDATLAAVGAPPSVRRSGAVWHALATGVLGTVLGALVGLVPGARFSHELTADRWAGVEGHVVTPEPWMPVAVLTTIVLAALVAGLLVRSRPDTAPRRRAG